MHVKHVFCLFSITVFPEIFPVRKYVMSYAGYLLRNVSSRKVAVLSVRGTRSRAFQHRFFICAIFRASIRPIIQGVPGEYARLRENVPYVKVHRYNPKHLYPKLKGYGDNGERCLKV